MTSETSSQSLPTLSGSEKQVAWATDLRTQFLTRVGEWKGENPEDAAEIEGLASEIVASERGHYAGFWIEERGHFATSHGKYPAGLVQTPPIWGLAQRARFSWRVPCSYGPRYEARTKS